MAQANPSWPAPPLFEADWRELPGALADDLQGRLTRGRRLIIQLAFGGRMERFRITPLPFWPGWMAVEALMIEADVADQAAAFLYGPFGPELLDGNSEVIHDINERQGVLLDTDARRHAYLRFFTSAVRGDEGAFFLVESDARLAELTGQKPRGKARGLGKAIRSRNGEGRQTLHDAVVFYGDALFRSTFSITPDGLVAMENDEVVVEKHSRPAFIFDGAFRRRAD